MSLAIYLRTSLLPLVLVAMMAGNCAAEGLETYSIELVKVDQTKQIALEPDHGGWPKPLRRPTLVQPLPLEDRPPLIEQPDAVLGSRRFTVPLGSKALAYWPDGKQIIAGDRHGSIRFFDALTGQPTKVIAAHRSEVACVAPIPGSFILCSSDGSEVSFWDTNTSVEHMRLRDSGSLTVSPGGQWIFTGSYLWRIDSVGPLTLSPRGIGFAKDGDKYGAPMVWNLFTPDDRYFVFGTTKDGVGIYDLQRNVLTVADQLDATKVTALAWGDIQPYVDIGTASPEDLLMLVSKSRMTLKAPAGTLKAFQPLVEAAFDLEVSQWDRPRAVAFSPNGQYLACTDTTNRIRVLDLEADGKPLASEEPLWGIAAMALSPDERLIAISHGELSVTLLDRTTGQVVAEVPVKSGIYGLEFSPDGKQLAISCGMRYVYLYEVESGQLNPFFGQQDTGGSRGLAFSTAGDILFVLSTKLMALDVNSRKLLDTVPAIPAQQRPIAVTPDDVIIGTSNSAWRFDQGRLVLQEDYFSDEAKQYFKRPYCVAVSPDGSVLAASQSEGPIRLWDLKKHRPMGQVMRGHTAWITEMAFSPDGKRLASASHDGTTWIWDIPTGRPLLALDADVLWTTQVAFLGDGNLLTGNAAGTVNFWDLNRHLTKP